MSDEGEVSDPLVNEFRLTEVEQKAITAGAVTLLRTEEPQFEKGQRVVALWLEPRWAGVPEDPASGAPAERWHIPAEPLIVIVLRRKIRRLNGWQIRFDVEDYRQEKPVYLARKAGYTTSPDQALDDQAVIDPATLKTVEMKGRLKRAKRDHSSELAARNQERAVREELRGTLRGLDPTARQALLAAVQRQIRAAKNETKPQAA